MANEPAAHEGSNLKMTAGYCRFLEDGDPNLTRLGLSQPKGAKAAWTRAILPPEGEADFPNGYSERMTLYSTTRQSYDVRRAACSGLDLEPRAPRVHHACARASSRARVAARRTCECMHASPAPDAAAPTFDACF